MKLNKTTKKNINTRSKDWSELVILSVRIVGLQCVLRLKLKLNSESEAEP